MNRQLMLKIEFAVTAAVILSGYIAAIYGVLR
jgi:hypothetical protein